jgi:CheY-like chemotaxis protein/HPt (histidine-containing phosphotransfer) domain-containing protein
MGGAISVHSTLGLGSRFAFRIHFALAEGRPCTTEAGPVGSASAAGESALVGTRILVAEDDPLNRSVVVALLSSVGARVAAVSSGAEVLEHLTGNECDLVVMDIQMPGMDGLETTRRIRSESSIGAIPVVALTANTRTEDRLACADAGMTGFAAKPIEPTTLLETLLTVLSRSTAAVGAPPEVVGSNGVEAVIDPSTAPRLLNNDAGLVARTYDLFVRSARMTLGEMEQALAVGDMRALGHLAHRLRGSSATIGSIPMAECCSDLEAASRISNRDTASRLLDRLRELAGLVTEELLALNRR